MVQTARGVVLDSKGRLLLVERHRPGQHYFVLPGGHVERGETPQQAVVREVHEETGLEVGVVKLLRSGVDGLGNKQQIYLCAYKGGQPALPPHSEEAHRAVQTSQSWRPAWFAPEALQGQTVYPEQIFDFLRQEGVL